MKAAADSLVLQGVTAAAGLAKLKSRLEKQIDRWPAIVRPLQCGRLPGLLQQRWGTLTQQTLFWYRRPQPSRSHQQRAPVSPPRILSADHSAHHCPCCLGLSGRAGFLAGPPWTLDGITSKGHHDPDFSLRQKIAPARPSVANSMSSSSQHQQPTISSNTFENSSAPRPPSNCGSSVMMLLSTVASQQSQALSSSGRGQRWTVFSEPWQHPPTAFADPAAVRSLSPQSISRLPLHTRRHQTRKRDSTSMAAAEATRGTRAADQYSSPDVLRTTSGQSFGGTHTT